MSVKRSHLVLVDSVLQCLGRGLLGRSGGVRVRKGEDMLRQRQQGPFGVLSIGAHDDRAFTGGLNGCSCGIWTKFLAA